MESCPGAVLGGGMAGLLEEKEGCTVCDVPLSRLLLQGRRMEAGMT